MNRSGASILLATLAFCVAGCAASSPEGEPQPTPDIPSPYQNAAVWVCDQAAQELGIQPATQACPETIVEYSEVFGGWPGPETIPGTGVSEAFATATGVTNAWTEQGDIQGFQGGPALETLLTHMQAARLAFSGDFSGMQTLNNK